MDIHKVMNNESRTKFKGQTLFLQHAMKQPTVNDNLFRALISFSSYNKAQISTLAIEKPARPPCTLHRDQLSCWLHVDGRTKTEKLAHRTLATTIKTDNFRRLVERDRRRQVKAALQVCNHRPPREVDGADDTCESSVLTAYRPA
jgi:hypothetical protein